MRLEVSKQTDPGSVRTNNEDAFFVQPPLVAVADGVGGHNAGEVASALAIDVLSEWISTLEREGAQRLRDAASDAHKRIYARAQEERELHGMATTLTAAWIEAGTCTIAHVGDSRAYLLRDGELRQLTEDHSWVAEMVRRGRITPEEAYEHPWRNLVVQALGGQPDVAVEMLSVSLRTGDRLVLASDGLSDMLRPETLTEILVEHTDGEIACRTLVERAKNAGGTDNITVVLVDVTGEDGDDAPGFVRRLLRRG